MLYSLTAASTKGSRRYMEDRMILRYSNESDLFLAILDGHGGFEASEHVRIHLWETMNEIDGFSSEDDTEVLSAMRQAFLQIHHEMREHRDSWPKRPNGYASTAGTTCTCALIRNNKLYTAHCGDSRIVLVTENDNEECVAIDLTQDHKPDDLNESERIAKDGGKITRYTSGCAVSRVMWTREIIGINNNRQTESIPFLSIARSLGDYWSYIEETGKYAVSPEPDLSVREINTAKDRYLVLMSDGITNVMHSNTIASMLDEWHTGMTRNLSRYLLKSSIAAWRNLKSDNMSIICLKFQNMENENEFTPMYELKDASQIESRLTSYPREIVLVYPQKVMTTNPDWDDLIVTKMDDDDSKAEVYSGPGFVSRNSLSTGNWRRTSCYPSLSPQSPKVIYPPSKFRSRFHTQPLNRRQYHLTLRRSLDTVGRVSSPFMLNRSPQRAKISRIEYMSCPSKRAISSAPLQRSEDDEEAEEEERPKAFRQSWPLSASRGNVITVVDKTESKIIIRPSSAKFHIRRVWPSLNSELTLEKDDSPPPSKQTKRVHNLEKDEIEAKRQNCQV